MTGDIDLSRFDSLLEQAKQAFSIDSSYAIAVAKPAGALVAKRRKKELQKRNSGHSPKTNV